jgi:hypothetical protein
LVENTKKRYTQQSHLTNIHEISSDFFHFFFNGYASFMIMFIIDQKKFEDALLGFSSMSAVSQFSASPTS